MIKFLIIILVLIVTGVILAILSIFPQGVLAAAIILILYKIDKALAKI